MTPRQVGCHIGQARLDSQHPTAAALIKVVPPSTHLHFTCDAQEWFWGGCRVHDGKVGDVDEDACVIKALMRGIATALCRAWSLSEIGVAPSACRKRHPLAGFNLCCIEHEISKGDRVFHQMRIYFLCHYVFVTYDQ